MKEKTKPMKFSIFDLLMKFSIFDLLLIIFSPFVTLGMVAFIIVRAFWAGWTLTDKIFKGGMK